jgi:hypothetical protein
MYYLGAKIPLSSILYNESKHNNIQGQQTFNENKPSKHEKVGNFVHTKSKFQQLKNLSKKIKNSANKRHNGMNVQIP